MVNKGLVANAQTFCCIALACRRQTDAMQLLTEMEVWKPILLLFIFTINILTVSSYYNYQLFPTFFSIFEGAFFFLHQLILSFSLVDLCRTLMFTVPWSARQLSVWTMLTCTSFFCTCTICKCRPMTWSSDSWSLQLSILLPMTRLETENMRRCKTNAVRFTK